MFKDYIETYKEYPIRMTTFTVIFSIIGILLGVGLKLLVQSNEIDYEHIFNTRLPQQVLIQGESGQLYLADTKKKSVQTLEMKADAWVFNPTFNQLILLNVESQKTKISILKKYKDIMIHADQIEVPIVMDDDHNFEMKFSDNQLFILDKTEHMLTQVDLEKKQAELTEDEKEDGPNISQVPIEFEVKQWEVREDSVYLMAANQVLNYDFKKAELQTVLENEALVGFHIYQNFLTQLLSDEEMAFLTSVDRLDKHFIDATAFESKEVKLLNASSIEPYVYFSHLNTQGGLSIHATDVKSYEIYAFDLNINQVNQQLHFFRGYSYYINQKNKAVIFRLQRGNPSNFN